MSKDITYLGRLRQRFIDAVQRNAESNGISYTRFAVEQDGVEKVRLVVGSYQPVIVDLCSVHDFNDKPFFNLWISKLPQELFAPPEIMIEKARAFKHGNGFINASVWGISDAVAVLSAINLAMGLGRQGDKMI